MPCGEVLLIRIIFTAFRCNISKVREDSPNIKFLFKREPIPL